MIGSEKERRSWTEKERVRLCGVCVGGNWWMTESARRHDSSSQCDQMFELKVPNFPNSCPNEKEHTADLNWRVPFLKLLQAAAKYLNYFLEQICSQDLSNLAQSDHTGPSQARAHSGTRVREGYCRHDDVADCDENERGGVHASRYTTTTTLFLQLQPTPLCFSPTL